MVAPAEVVRRLVSACPEFEDAWHAHLAWWEGEHAGEYNDLGALADWLVSQIEQGLTGCFPTLFKEVETLVSGADAEIHNLLVIGFLEDIQNLSLNRGVDPDFVLGFLGPETRKGWFELVAMWHGRDGQGWPGQKHDQ